MFTHEEVLAAKSIPGNLNLKWELTQQFTINNIDTLIDCCNHAYVTEIK